MAKGNKPVGRDYKRKTGGSSGGLSGTTGLVLGLVIGLGAAVAVYLSDHRTSKQPEKPEPAKTPLRKQAEEEPPEDSGRKYDFYEMLPKFEVVVPERERAEAPDPRATNVQRAGSYVLQAGSYRSFADADRIRAQLALQGIESKIQRVSVDSDTWHRVRIGPISNLAELNRIRATLRKADIEALVIRVGD